MPSAAWGGWQPPSRTKDFLPLGPASLCCRAFSNMTSYSAHGSRGQKCQIINTSGSDPQLGDGGRNWWVTTTASCLITGPILRRSHTVYQRLPSGTELSTVVNFSLTSPVIDSLIPFLGLIPGVTSQMNYSGLPLGNLHEDQYLLWEGKLPPGPRRRRSSSP